MSHINVTVNGKTLMDADTGEWRTTPPDLASLNLAASHHTGPRPWLNTIMMCIAEAATKSLAGNTTPAPATHWTIEYETTDTATRITVTTR